MNDQPPQIPKNPVPELFEEILYELKDQNSWKDNLMAGIQNRIDYVNMESFEDVYELFEKRFLLLTKEFTAEESKRYFDNDKSGIQAKFKILEEYGLFLRLQRNDGPITVSILRDGDFEDIYDIRVRKNRFKINRELVDALFKAAFEELIIDTFGFEVD